VNIELQFLVALSGSLVGAGGAITSAALIRSQEVKRQEITAVKALVADLHFRRALAVNDGEQVPNADLDRADLDRAELDRSDLDRSTRSVINIRREIRETRMKLRPKSPAFEEMSRMTRACNLYLEVVEIRPGDYRIELSRLRESLTARVVAMTHALRLDLPELMPGQGAFPAESAGVL
jgi:hypothetical protein